MERIRTTDKPTKERRLDIKFGESEFRGDEVLTIKELKKSFDGRTLFDHVNLEVIGGERIALLGDNGTGKSTLLKIIIGAQPQTSGTMSFHGAPYEPKTPMDANKAGVGMVFQEQSLIVTLNVAQNIFFGHEKDFKRPVSSTGPR